VIESVVEGDLIDRLINIIVRTQMIEGIDNQGNPVSYTDQQSAALEDLTQLSSLAIESSKTNLTI
jgi:hypothetical protein